MVFGLTPLNGSHGAPMFPAEQVAPADVTTAPGGIGNTIVNELLNVVMPILRVIVVVVAAGTWVLPAPLDVSMVWVSSVPVLLNPTVRVPPGRVSRPLPPLAC